MTQNLSVDSYISFEEVKHVTPEQFFNGSILAINAFKNKYLVADEKNPAEVFWRVAKYIASAEKENREYWAKRWFHEIYTGQWMPAGSILQGAANPKKISMANCTTLGFADDSLESIFETGYKVAKVAAYRQGLGVHYNLRPKSMKVNNSSNLSEGNTHWIKWINEIGHFVGQKGRIPAMLYSISDTNPDLLDFITLKSDQKTVDNANISVQFSDAFMKCLEEDGIWKFYYEAETGEKLETEIQASIIFDKFVENNWAFAEPGAQFIDTARRLSNSDYLDDAKWKIKSTNACCVVGTTKIETNYGQLYIEEIHKRVLDGDRSILAVSFNEETHMFELQPIINSWQQRNDKTVELEIEENDIVYKIECSADHPILTRNRGFIAAIELTENDNIVIFQGYRDVVNVAELKSIKIHEEIKPLYDIEVHQNHNFIANSIVVHNSEQFLEFLTGKSAGLCMLLSCNYMYLYRIFGNDVKAACEYLRYTLSPSMLRFIDNVVQKEIEDKRFPIKEQLNSLKGLRRVGAGITNLDGYLIYNGIGYDTEEGINTIVKLTDAFNVGLYEESIRIGKEKGSFEAFNRTQYEKSPFVSQMIKRHNLVFETMRNVCCSSIAPTGTLSLMFSDLVSYGIEPILGLYYWKRNRTSGKWSWSFCVPSFVREVLREKGIEFPMESDSIEDDDVGSKGEQLAILIDKHFPSDKFKPAHLINPFNKVKLMAKLTSECIDSSISVTYNLPEDVSRATIKEIYLQAWKSGVKSISIYRDKSRYGVVEFESPRIASKRYSNEEKSEMTNISSTLKRPKELEADVYQITVNGEKWIAFLGKFQDKPYEIFAGRQDEVKLPSKYKTGKIIKEKQNYYFSVGEDDDQLLINITKSFKNDEHSALTRQVSLNLRHSTPLAYIIDQLDKSHGTIVDFSKVLMRVLKNYFIPDDASKLKCSNCKNYSLVFQEKCFVCVTCGESKCS